jgi:hypothetical protein
MRFKIKGSPTDGYEITDTKLDKSMHAEMGFIPGTGSGLRNKSAMLIPVGAETFGVAWLSPNDTEEFECESFTAYQETREGSGVWVRRQ